MIRGDDSKQAVWDEFLGVFLNHFFPQELGESSVKEFVNLKQGKMSVKKYALKFTQLSYYAPELVYSMRGCMREICFWIFP